MVLKTMSDTTFNGGRRRRTRKRSSLEVAYDILACAVKGATAGKLRTLTGSNHWMKDFYLNDLVERGLLAKEEGQRDRYKTTTKGLEVMADLRKALQHFDLYQTNTQN